MSSQHRDPALTIRPPADVVARAREVLAEHGWELKEWATAALTDLGERPAEVLAELTPHRPPAAPRGRPPRTPAE